MSDAWILVLIYWALTVGALFVVSVKVYLDFRRRGRVRRRMHRVSSPFDEPSTQGGGL
jgi:hypothetical protein